MAKTPKVMLDASGGNNLTVLPIEQILKQKSAQPISHGESAVDFGEVSTPVQSSRATPKEPPSLQFEHIRQGRGQ